MEAGAGAQRVADSVTYDYLVAERGEIDDYGLVASRCSDIEVIPLSPKAVVNVPVDVGQNRPAVKKCGQTRPGARPFRMPRLRVLV